MDKSQRHRLRERIVELEAQLRIANDRFEAHTKHVSAFLSEMYAVMIDPLDSSDLKVAEMTATLLDAAKRDRETANMHADALGALRGQLEHADEIIAQMETDLCTANETINNLDEANLAYYRSNCNLEVQVAQQAATIGELRNLVQKYVDLLRNGKYIRIDIDAINWLLCASEEALAKLPKEKTT